MKLNAIQKTIESIRELPTLPMIANRVNALLYNPRSSAQDLQEVIEKDQSITAKVLRLVNSAQYSLPKRVTNIAQAIALLGYKNISYIVMTLSVFDTLKAVKRGSFDRRKFWIHSIATGLISMKIAERCMFPMTEDIFTAGLLHDLGKVFMDGYLHAEFESIVRLAEDRNISFFEAENILYDVDHAKIGELITRMWKLPLPVIAAVKHHHQEAEVRKGLSLSSDPFIDIIQIADIGVKVFEFGHSGDGTGYKPSFEKKHFLRLPISENEVVELLGELRSELEKSQTLLTLAI